MTLQGPDHRRGAGSSGEDERALTGPDPGGQAQDRETRPDEDTDVLLDVPRLNVEELNLEVDNLRAVVSAKAELAGFLSINVGVDAYLENVKLEVKGVEAQVQLKVNLERILGSIDKALQAIDDNPQLLDPSLRKRDRGPQDADRPRGLPEGGGGAGATEAARKKAEELGVDLSQIEGTGAGGRVLVKDVLKAAR